MDAALLHPDHIEYPGQWPKSLLAMGFVPIGIVQLNDGGEFYPLAVREDGRIRVPVAFIDGAPIDLDIDAVGPAIYDAIDEACTKLWGHAWNAALGELFGLNRRTLQRDRVSRYLLPTSILSTLSYIASADDADELAKTLLAVAAYHRRFENRQTVEKYVADAVRVFYDHNRAPGFRLG